MIALLLLPMLALMGVCYWLVCENEKNQRLIAELIAVVCAITEQIMVEDDEE